ncbi:MAG: diaminopimelate epimerase [Archaeoglobus sp.]|nr:diaminopimelate epimerase [Archaeoglobus sp.]
MLDLIPQGRIFFVKMHGNGNDFVLFDEFEQEIIPERIKPELVRLVCDRRFGIGADGVLFVQPSAVANARFRYFNSDGSEAEMCGNGIRCFSRYIVEEGYANPGNIRVETLVGILDLRVEAGKEYKVKVNMGTVKTSPKEIPAKKELWGEEMEVKGKKLKVYAVNSGVPHVVIFLDENELGSLDIIPISREIRYNDLFPEGTNVNFVSVSRGEIKIRTYERGVEDETLSCGTGSVASAYVALKKGLVSEPVRVHTRGGDLIIEFKNGNALMTGGAARVFDGMLNLSELGNLHERF